MRTALIRSLLAGALATGLVVGPLGTPAAAARTKGLTAVLLGANEVGQGDPNASGVALFDVRTGSGKLCYVIWIRNVDGIVDGAHLHLGDAGENGEMVAELDAPVWWGSVAACTNVGSTLAKAVWKSPQDYYVNIHSTAYPDGAVRGQLHRTT